MNKVQVGSTLCLQRAKMRCFGLPISPDRRGRGRNQNASSASLILILSLLSGFLFSCQPSLPTGVEQAYQALPDQIDFNFYIRPILADRCFSCHGPDANTREAEFRLDLAAAAFAPLKESVGHAFVKGNPGKSVAWQRILSNDPDFQMPPPESHLSLTDTEKALLTKWIEQGAQWQEHWAFLPVKKPEIPDDFPAAWPARTPIDQFVFHKLLEKGLRPSPETNKERLIRRLSFDLRGLPPSWEEVQEFVADTTADAYEKQVDRFLQSDAHAERLTMEWLDVARYGDTQGMHTDWGRYHWPWRDWVIRAFRDNLPYDEFIRWQMAGDLLPQASREQKLATAFHRNHPVSAEGGVPNEEFRQKYVQDRTNTTATAFLGLTLECATCHDHKFDPISQKEYYQMSAFFNNMKEVGLVAEFGISSGPVMALPEPEQEQEIKALAEQIQQIRTQRQLSETEWIAQKGYLAQLQKESVAVPKADFYAPFESIRPHRIDDGVVHRIQGNSPINQMVDRNPRSLACGNPQLVPGKVGQALRSVQEVDLVFLKGVGTFELFEPYSAGAWVKTEKEGENQTLFGTSGELGNAWRGWDFFLDSLNRPSVRMISIWPHNYLQVTAETAISKDQWQHVLFTYDGSAQAAGVRLYVDGKSVPTQPNYDKLYGPIVRDWKGNPDWPERPAMVFRSGRYHTGENGVFTGSLDEVKVFKRLLSPLEVAALVQADLQTELPPEAADAAIHFLQKDPGYQELSKQLRDLLAQQLALTRDIPEIMVLEDMPIRRKTYVLNRGQYNEPTEEVQPGTPQQVLAFDPALPQNRLGLAEWLVDPHNPLTARVTVNRYWQMIFGKGIVETAHDFGTQGALPSHPELLDWLAADFVASGWDLRQLLKKMVMSTVYRQSSVVLSEHSEKDPLNRYLAHAPSYRLQAEMIRDNALAASGLLNFSTGGPSVKPYQPDGVWDFGGVSRYQADAGASLYRRSLYTYLRRTTPHPAMTAFDAPNRLTCTAKRENTNTPLQALVLLNDPQFVEASRVLAQKMLREGGTKLADRIQFGFQRLCGRTASPGEEALLREQYQLALARYQEDPAAAADLLQVGEFPPDPTLDQIQSASLTLVASTMMNFDEAYMKR